jgi:hypothetical protein
LVTWFNRWIKHLIRRCSAIKEAMVRLAETAETVQAVWAAADPVVAATVPKRSKTQPFLFIF